MCTPVMMLTMKWAIYQQKQVMGNQAIDAISSPNAAVSRW